MKRLTIEQYRKDIANRSRYKGIETIQTVGEYLTSGYRDAHDGNGVLPTIEGLLNILGITRATHSKWVKTNPDYAQAIEHLQQVQADILINGALTGELHNTTARLLLNKHGYGERVEHALVDADSDNNGRTIPVIFKGVANDGQVIDVEQHEDNTFKHNEPSATDKANRAGRLNAVNVNAGIDRRARIAQRKANS